MKRRLLHLFTAVSLLVCALAVTLWMRSYTVELLVGHTTMRPVGTEWYWRMGHAHLAHGCRCWSRATA